MIGVYSLRGADSPGLPRTTDPGEPIAWTAGSETVTVSPRERGSAGDAAGGAAGAVSSMRALGVGTAGWDAVLFADVRGFMEGARAQG